MFAGSFCTGFGLNFMKMEAEWESGGAHKPAFFLATNNDAKELLLSIRGTSELQDVMADVTAVPEVYLSCCCSVETDSFSSSSCILQD